MNNTTLIAVASRGGVTEEYASIIADVLRQEYEFNVDVVKIGNTIIDVTPYNYVIVGSGVRTFRMHREARFFLENTNFSDKPVAIFLSSVEPKDDALKKYIKPIKEKNRQLKPIATEVFGGRMKIFGKTITDMRELDRVKSWAKELGKKLTN
jgi:menaquinone-dependent protoporphyrinogen IX oxidase